MKYLHRSGIVFFSYCCLSFAKLYPHLSNVKWMNRFWLLAHPIHLGNYHLQDNTSENEVQGNETLLTFQIRKQTGIATRESYMFIISKKKKSTKDLHGKLKTRKYQLNPFIVLPMWPFQNEQKWARWNRGKIWISTFSGTKELKSGPKTNNFIRFDYIH